MVFLGGVGWTLQTSQVSVKHHPFMFDRMSCYCCCCCCCCYYYYYYYYPDWLV